LSRAVEESPPPPLYAGPVKRSMTIAGHTTSISLEPVFWRALEDRARALGLPLNALVARIDAARIAVARPPNLASALRCWLLAATGRSGGGAEAGGSVEP
jgi:predicted DNA-binding ribbon-helix-helix protein